MNKTICLIGNPNCGKTTLFNALTGTYQKVGNFAGVTTESKTGNYRKDKSVEITDLPGLYSLSADSKDEIAVIDYLKSHNIDVIINVLDGTNLERNLYLTCELAKLNIPTVIAVNFCDDLNKNGIKLNVDKLSKIFGVPVISVSALKKTNLDMLMEKAYTAFEKPKKVNVDYYKFIEGIINDVIEKKITKGEKFTVKADRLIMGKLGIPIFFFVITAVYYLTNTVGGVLGDKLSALCLSFSSQTANSLYLAGANEWFVGLFVSAVLKGVGAIIAFLPQILILFFLMTIIEESGYASRVSFLFDKFFNKFGLGGKSVIPIMLSCGCNVTGIMASRTIETENERKMTVFLSPFMPCSAKTAVFAWLSKILFNGNPFIATCMYFLSITIVAVSGKLLKRSKYFSGDNGEFILELPTYRFPSLKDIASVMWEKSKDFIYKAGTVIFSISVILWALGSFGISGYVGTNMEKSFLYYIGNVFKYVFYPLGFCNWQTAVSVLTGILAKEAVVESLGYLSSDVAVLFNNKFSAVAFMAFVLLSPPCLASLIAAKKELKDRKSFVFMIVFQTLTAYIVALIINVLGIIYYSQNKLLFSVIAVIIITLSLISLKTVVKGKCVNCGKNTGGCKECKKTVAVKHNTI